ncbi:neuronal acetylcholine receptor subunit alpha-10 isoform X2 [Hydra vulgaris]|uniref:Neuronal acetylcholine receptor subunit alpha-10 isoform X2 n=1 Tax=Hydra vulgaris TaxID=6087 RepID=A0ABM4C7K0_HYDVU
MILYIYLLTVVAITNAENTRDEVELIKNLIRAEHSDALPRHPGQPVNMTFDIALHQLLELDEKVEILMVVAWIRMFWHDPFMIWNATEWSGINSVTISPDKIWKPDLTLYNNAENNFQGFDQYGKTKITVYSNGEIVWFIPSVLRVSCKLEMTYFPFDVQTCPLIFGSWSFDQGSLDIHLKNSTGDLTQMTKSGEFVIDDFKASRQSLLYPCCKTPYAVLTYNVTLRRRAKFYLFNLILPGVLIALLSCFSFFLPPMSGERTGLVITNFLSLSVYILIVSDSVPPSSDTVPLLVKFYTILVTEIGLALMANCVVISLVVKTNPVPGWVRSVFLQNHWKKLYSILRSMLSTKFHLKDSEHHEKNMERENNKLNGTPLLHTSLNQDKSVNIEETEQNSVHDTTFSCPEKISYLKNISDFFDRFAKDDEVRKDWENVVKSIDNICFLVFITVILASVILMFSKGPHIIL